MNRLGMVIVVGMVGILGWSACGSDSSTGTGTTTTTTTGGTGGTTTTGTSTTSTTGGTTTTGGATTTTTGSTTGTTTGGAGTGTASNCTLENATETTSVMIHGSAFVPSCLKVSQHATVTFTNHDGFNHTVTTDTSQAETFNSGNFTSTPYSRIFDVLGTIKAHCAIHTSMHVTILVN